MEVTGFVTNTTASHQWAMASLLGFWHVVNLYIVYELNSEATVL